MAGYVLTGGEQLKEIWGFKHPDGSYISVRDREAALQVCRERGFTLAHMVTTGWVDVAP